MCTSMSYFEGSLSEHLRKCVNSSTQLLVMKDFFSHFLVMAVVMLVFQAPIVAQNLVPNPSFEDYYDCPTALDQIEVVKHWTSPSPDVAPDFLHSCSDETFGISVPENWVGFQYAHEGEGYLGMLMHKEGANLREYVQTELTESLVEGVCYEFSMFVSLMELSEVSINNIGVHISHTPVEASGWENIDVLPQIVNHTNSFLSDQNTWTEIKGYYQAEGGEKYLTIGNFFDEFDTDSEEIENDFDGEIIAFYALDEVSLAPIPTHELSFKLDLDSVFCNIDHIQLSSNYVDYNAEYLWSTGDIEPIITVSASGTYWVEIENACVQQSDTIRVSFQDTPTVDWEKETTICNTGGTFLTAPYLVDTEYIWSDGFIGYSRFVNDPGLYILNASNYCGAVSDSIYVHEEICDCPVQFPNAFSPNGDGLNDIFRPVSVCGFNEYELQIFDRWGNKVFASSDSENGWNGTMKNQDSPIGTYVYVLKFETELGTASTMKGAVSVLR